MKVALDIAPFLISLGKEDQLPLSALTVLALVVENPGKRQSQLLREFEMTYSRQALHNLIKRLNAYPEGPLLVTSTQGPEGEEVQGLYPTALGQKLIEDLKGSLLGTFRVG